MELTRKQVLMHFFSLCVIVIAGDRQADGGFWESEGAASLDAGGHVSV